MKILQVYRHSPRTSIGGVLYFMTSLATQLSAMGVENNILSVSKKSSGASPLKDEFANVEYDESFSILGSPISIQLIKDFRRITEQYDLIHFQSPCVLSLLLSFITSNRPYIITYHADITSLRFIYFFYSFFEWLFLKKARAIVVTSPQYLETSKPLRGLKNKVQIITIGIKEKKIRHGEISLKFRQKDPEFPKRYFLFLGAKRHYKGLDLISKVAQKYPHINFVLAGPNTEKQQTSLENIFGLGQVDETDKLSLLYFCDCLILPSNNRAEALGISLIEGAMFSKPLVSCEIASGTSYVNKNGITGFVVRPDSAEELGDAILKLHNDFKLRKKFGEKAYERYQEIFRVELMAQDYKDLYNRVLM